MEFASGIHCRIDPKVWNLLQGLSVALAQKLMCNLSASLSRNDPKAAVQSGGFTDLLQN